MVEGRLKKFKAEIALVDQPFVKDPDMTVEKYVASKGATVKSLSALKSAKVSKNAKTTSLKK